MTQKRFRAAAMLVVFTVSAVVHEYVLAICFGFFYPVLFCLFMCFGSKNLIYYISMVNIPAEKLIVLAGLSWSYSWPSWCLFGQQLFYQKTIQTDQFNQLGQAGMPDNHLEIAFSFSYNDSVVFSVFHGWLTWQSLNICNPLKFLLVAFNFVLHDRRKGPIWNVIMWTSLFLGQGVLICLYSQEWYARRYCSVEEVNKVLVYIFICECSFMWIYSCIGGFLFVSSALFHRLAEASILDLLSTD